MTHEPLSSGDYANINYRPVTPKSKEEPVALYDLPPLAKGEEFDVDPSTNNSTPRIQVLEVPDRPSSGRWTEGDMEEEEEQASGNPEEPTETFWSQLSLQKKALAIGTTVLIPVVILIAILADGLHTIDEGHVGIYFRLGSLQTTYSLPGLRWCTPLVTSEVLQVEYRPHTDILDPIYGVTKDGITNIFKDIQVLTDVKLEQVIPMVRRFGKDFKRALVYDRVSEELRLFCANHTVNDVYNEMFLDIVQLVRERTEQSISRLGNDSVRILNLVVPKPDIPSNIVENYRKVKVQWTYQLVAVQEQKTEKIRKDTESLMAVADAEREKAVLEIELEKQLLQKEGDKNISTLQNVIVKHREETLAQMDNYKKTRAAEGNQALYTPEYINLNMAKSLANNTKFYFSGETSALGSLITNLLN